MVLLTVDEVAKHNTEKDCWIIVKGKVYEVTDYLDDHPGGVEIITDLAGMDTTEDFEDVGHSEEAYEQLKDYYIGDVGGESIKDVKAGTGSAPAKQAAPVVREEPQNPPQLLEKRPEIFEQPQTVSKSSSYQAPKKKSPKSNNDDSSGMMLVGAGVVGVIAVGYYLLRKKK
mmetsp:Transcript_99362/g.138064  ORF Transcript_99362/g.138064 Transcript_99362/m.138064 type:complete len:171 (-) Transcript_99362:103-615(-)